MPSVFEPFKNEIIITVIVVLSLISIFLYIDTKLLRADVKDKEVLIKGMQSDIDLQNRAILTIKADYEDKLDALPKEITKIETKYKTIYQKVEVIKDSNETCDNIISSLNSSDY